MEPRISIITLGVSDMPRAIRFYRDGLGLPTSADDTAVIAFFRMQGTTLALYPRDALAQDAVPGNSGRGAGFCGITLAYNTRAKDEVEETLRLAEKAGAVIVKPAQDAGWGGYHGYFADPDGYLWEVAWSAKGEFHPDGSLVID